MVKTIAVNRKARHDYHIDKTFEAGIKLTGSEIKSIRLGGANIGDCYVTIRENEVYIINMHVKKYEQSSIFNHEETRTRKLLLNRREITNLSSHLNEKGNAIIPLKLYFKGSLLKVEIALARGKKLHDKRETLKERDMKRRVEKQLKYINK